MKKTILLLGGSRQQVPVIEKAKEAGYRTVLIDYLPDNPGKEVADKWYCESTTDVEAVYRIAKKEYVSGILAYASDPAALPAAIVCERLGLPTNPSKSVEILGVKHKFREFLQQNGFACPKHYSFRKDISIEDLKEFISEFNFPIVVKPTDSSGSKGVSFLKDSYELPQALFHAREYSRNGILIVEEYIQRGYPSVIGGDIFVQDGKIVVYGDMDCMRDESNNGLIPVGKIYPNKLSEVQKKNLYRELNRLFKLLNIQFGEFNIEVIIDKENNPHFLEVGPRAGGNMIPIELSDALKVDLLKANVETAMGSNITLQSLFPTNFYMTHVLHSAKDGTFKDIKIDEAIQPYIYRKIVYKEKGQIIEKFDGAGKAIGIVFFCFPDINKLNYFSKRISEFIKIII